MHYSFERTTSNTLLTTIELWFPLNIYSVHTNSPISTRPLPAVYIHEMVKTSFSPVRLEWPDFIISLYENYPESFPFLLKHPICFSISQTSSADALNNIRELQVLSFCAKEAVINNKRFLKYWQQFCLGFKIIMKIYWTMYKLDSG